MLKRIAIILVIICAVLAAGYLLLNLLISHMLALPLVKRELANRVEKKFGRKVKIQSLSLNIFGDIEARNIVVTDRAGFDDTPFFHSKSVSARLKWLPLFKKEFTISHLIFTEPMLTLKVSESGELNIEDLLGKGESASPDELKLPQPGETADDIPDEPLHLNLAQRSFTVKSLALRGATIRFIDDSLNRHEEVPGIDIAIRANFSDGLINVPRLTVRLAPAKFVLWGNVSRRLDHARFSVKASSFNLMEMRDRIAALRDFTGGRLCVSNLSARINLEEGVFSITDLYCNASGGEFSGAFTLDISEDPWRFFVRFHARNIRLDPFLWNTRADGLSFGGILTMTAWAKGRGFKRSQLEQYLEGSGKINVINGRFQNPIFAAIDDILDALMGIRPLQEFRSNASGTFHIEKGKGRISTEDLQFASRPVSLFTAEKGYFGLGGEIDFPRAVILIGSKKVPIQIKGTIHEPTVLPHMKSFGERLFKHFWK